MEQKYNGLVDAKIADGFVTFDNPFFLEISTDQFSDDFEG
jgi:hypothetical protein